jgi:hypothetical protein
VATRPSSADKPEVAALKERGVEIRVADFDQDEASKVREALAGVDVLISAVFGDALKQQERVFAVAKEVNPKMRVVPCDFATHAPAGGMELSDNVRLCCFRPSSSGMSLTRCSNAEIRAEGIRRETWT